MMATTHALVGCLIAAAVPNPIVAGGLIVVSHIGMDMIPHWDFGTDWVKRPKYMTGLLALGDTLLALLLSFVLFYQSLSPLLIVLAFSLSNILDWMEAPYFMFFASKKGHDYAAGKMGQFLAVFHRFQEDYLHTTSTFPFGVITQITTVLFFYFLLK